MTCFPNPLDDHLPPDGALADAGRWRMIDANTNRAGEAFRVVEDILRLGFGEAHLTERTKHLRHRLGAVVQQLDLRARISARDIAGDCGRAPTCPSEYQRDSWSALLAANWKRAQQALRSLEEALKSFDAALAQQCETLRYEAYALEQASLLLATQRPMLQDIRLCVLVDGGETEEAFVQLIQALAAAPVDLIQLRDKRLNDRALLARGRRLTELLRGTDTPWVMNDRADLAVESGARGVHLGQEDLPIVAARRIVGSNLWIGVSTHSPAEAAEAAEQGATYIGVGPVFASPTKSFAQLQGTELVRRVADLTSLPAFAIGGINLTNLETVLAAGARRVAVGSGITTAKDPAEAARRLRAKLVSIPPAE